MRHLVGSSLLSGLAAGLLLGCSLSTVGAMDPAEGGKCDLPMQSKTANDGCTECVCNGKTWDCSSDACMASCNAGDTKTADDGCNTCSCGMDGKWSCTTDQMCPTTPTPMPECQAGDTKLRDDGCYRCSCDMSGHWDCPDTACITCKPGETKAGATECITCTCSDDGTAWNCLPTLDKGCPASTCTPGETMPSADGCNTCTCAADGTLACTMKYCDPCPAPRTDGGMCTAETIFAQDPQTKTCCGYSSKCEAPAGWTLYPTAECTPTTPPTMCAAGMADCDGDAADGCETNVMTSALNCGACGNVCSVAGGTASCDQGKCVSPSEPNCFYNGVEHRLGDKFFAQDGCGQCSCMSVDFSMAEGSGDVFCEDIACQCDPSRKSSFLGYIETDPTKCDPIPYMCPENTTVFKNECGCGCEQSVDCPVDFDCTPDPMTMQSACDSALAASCPYSNRLN